MTTQHTQGRLTVRGGYSIYADDGKTPVADTCLTNSEPANDEANARRLVACWNRLEKFTTEQIEDLGYDLFADVRPDFERAMRERDELLNDLRPLITKRMGAEQIREGIQRAIARAAIAKAERKQ